LIKNKKAQQLLCFFDTPHNRVSRNIEPCSSGRCPIAVFTAPNVRVCKRTSQLNAGREVCKPTSNLFRAPLIKCRFNRPDITGCAGFFSVIIFLRRNRSRLRKARQSSRLPCRIPYRHRWIREFPRRPRSRS